MEKYLEFMEKLRQLCAEYEASIAGCGCCGSPSGNVGLDEFSNLNVSGKEIEAQWWMPPDAQKPPRPEFLSPMIKPKRTKPVATVPRKPPKLRKLGQEDTA